MKKIKKGLIAVFVGAVVLNAIPYNISDARRKTSASELENSYIIVTKDERSAEKVTDKYQYVLDVNAKDNSGNLTGEGILVSDMTPSEAEKLQKDRSVLSVEKNITIDGNSFSKNTHKKKKKYKKDDNWNIKAIHADKARCEFDMQNDLLQSESKEELSDGLENAEKIKVAIIDSGVDFLENIIVKERINLIPGQEEFTEFFEDETGHGTAVASIIAGKKAEGMTAEGVAKNVELYSAKVLDANNQAPLSRIVEGIYWAIEKKVNIINMSFGTPVYSEAMERAIKDAADAGILLIAAAGNGGEQEKDTVEYPAAFEEVMAVGSVNAEAETSKFSARGEEIELVAPGEAVRATGAFGEDVVVSGTSMAAPHVTGVAALLWAKERGKSAVFIRTLLDKSARTLEDRASSGYGLADYAYAESIYDEVALQMKQGDTLCESENDTQIQVFDNQKDAKLLEDEEEVNGSWTWDIHREYLNTQTGSYVAAMKDGAVYPDKSESGVHGMEAYPEFHGYYRKVEKTKDGKKVEKRKVNYVAAYDYIIAVADAYGKGNTYTSVKRSNVKGLDVDTYNVMNNAFKGMKKKINSFSKKSDKKAFVYGIAMHNATDAFSHSTFRYVSGRWERITHNDTDDAHSKHVKPRRYKMALRIERNVVYRYQGKRNDVPVPHDFHAHGDENGEYYDEDKGNTRYRIKRLEEYAKAVGVTNKTVLNHFKMVTLQ